MGLDLECAKHSSAYQALALALEIQQDADL